MFIILSATHKISASGPEHEAILNWWQNEASVQKPLKCVLDPSYKEELLERLPNSESKLVLSKACEEGQDGSAFDFKGSGKIVDGVLQGPGKLKIHHENLENAMYGAADRSCLTFEKTRDGHSLATVIGTFKDGLLEGILSFKRCYRNLKDLLFMQLRAVIRP